MPSLSRDIHRPEVAVNNTAGTVQLIDHLQGDINLFAPAMQFLFDLKL